MTRNALQSIHVFLPPFACPFSYFVYFGSIVSTSTVQASRGRPSLITTFIASY